MIKLVVGLGNPGRQYEKTRHNVGFLFLDYLLGDSSSLWSHEAKFQALQANAMLAGTRLLLLKPQTFMNKSGSSVGAVARYYKISPEEILVVHDELDLEPGVVRLKQGGGHAGHNGLRDIIANLGGREFLRLRVGIGRPRSGGNVADYVLSAPGSKEWSAVELAFDQVSLYLKAILSGEISVVMNQLNKK